MIALFLQEYIIQYLPTTLGTYIIDTAGSYHYKFHYNQIKAIGKAVEKKGFEQRQRGEFIWGRYAAYIGKRCGLS
jgi:hypothetical protein